MVSFTLRCLVSLNQFDKEACMKYLIFVVCCKKNLSRAHRQDILCSNGDEFHPYLLRLADDAGHPADHLEFSHYPRLTPIIGRIAETGLALPGASDWINNLRGREVSDFLGIAECLFSFGPCEKT